MSFFPTSDNPTRRFRSRRDIMRDASPESDMFFESSPAFGLARSHLADRLGSSVFEDFPTRRTMRSFPSHSDTPTFGSLHRHRQHPSNWGTASENLGSQESSPTEGRDANMRHPFFQRSESIPVRVSHESRHGSRSSTPESTGSGHSHASSSHSRPHSNGADSTQDGGYDDNVIPEGVEEHPGVASRTGRPSFTARRQPKVHHIPIHVEPRDGSHPVVLTPPAETTNSRATPDLTQNKVSPPVPPKKTVKQIFAMPGPPNVPRDSPDARNSSGNVNNINNNNNNNSGAAVEEISLSTKDNAPKERAVPISLPENEEKQKEVPKAASPTTVETEVTVTLPAADKKRKTAVELVEEVRLDVEHQRKCVEEFAGTRGDKQYLYLDEMLTRDLIKLDNISTEGDEELRKARRAVIVAINGCIQALEQKVSDAEKSGKAEVAAAEDQNESAGGEDQQTEEMDVVRKAEEGEATNPPANQNEQTLKDEEETQNTAVDSEQQQVAESQPDEVPPSELTEQQQQETTSTAKAEEVPMETEVSAAVPVETSV